MSSLPNFCKDKLFLSGLSSSFAFTILLVTLFIIPSIQANSEELNKRTAFVYQIPDIEKQVDRNSQKLDKLLVDTTLIKAKLDIP